MISKLEDYLGKIARKIPVYAQPFVFLTATCLLVGGVLSFLMLVNGEYFQYFFLFLVPPVYIGIPITLIVLLVGLIRNYK